MTVLEWPESSPDNNLYSLDGNPSIDEFTCDVSKASSGTVCSFDDLKATNIKGASAYCHFRRLFNNLYIQNTRCVQIEAIATSAPVYVLVSMALADRLVALFLTIIMTAGTMCMA